MDTKLANVAKVQFYKNPITSVVPMVPKAPNVVPMVPKAPNVVPIVPKIEKKDNSCPVCPQSQACPAVPNCPQASKNNKTMFEQLMEEVERERISASMFGGKRKTKM